MRFSYSIHAMTCLAKPFQHQHAKASGAKVFQQNHI